MQFYSASSTDDLFNNPFAYRVWRWSRNGRRVYWRIWVFDNWLWVWSYHQSVYNNRSIFYYSFWRTFQTAGRDDNLTPRGATC
jgi:hypothetical protein